MSEESFYRGVLGGGRLGGPGRHRFCLDSIVQRSCLLLSCIVKFPFIIRQVDEVLLIISVHKGHRIDYCD